MTVVATDERRQDPAADRPHLGVVFYVSLTLAVAFIGVGLAMPEWLTGALVAAQEFVLDTVGHAYPVTVLALLLFVLGLAVSPIGRERLGKPGERPAFGWLSWFAMLLSAGVGLSYLFWGTAQPLLHAAEPPYGAAAPGSAEAAKMGMRYSYLFWGIHAWAIYAVVAIAVAYASFRRGNRVLISAALRPLLGDRVDGVLGKVIDVFVVFAILFGIATSLGLGSRELNSGLAHAFGLPESYGIQIAIIAGLMTVSTISAMTGLARGIRILSLINIGLCAALLLFVLATGPTARVAGSLVDGVRDYFAYFLPMSLATESGPQPGWKQDWIFFFWAWWISWAPFVGTFIARISKGRTIRSVVTGVVLVPGAVTVVWFSVFGGTTLDRARSGAVDMADVAQHGKAVVTFNVLGTLPFPRITAVVVVVVLALLFITSADSASFMLGSSTSGGSMKPPRPLRLLWAFGAAFAAVLLLTGGTESLQGAAVVAAIPFAVILVGLGISLIVAVLQDRRKRRRDAPAERR